jgi:hypothetical protein
MDKRERSCTDEEKIRLAFDAMQAGLWTSMPGTIQSFDEVNMTSVVQPTIMGRIRDKVGKIIYVPMPLLVDCPTQFVGGGGFTQTFPVKEGDECLVIFADRCIDAWWQSGGIQQPMELRMHDLSDSFVILGFRSKPRVLANISTTSVQLRSDDGGTFFEVAGGGVVAVKAPTKILLDTPLVEVRGIVNVINENSEVEPFTVNGDINTNGNVFAQQDVRAATVSLRNHVHPQSGGGNTGAPVP